MEKKIRCVQCDFIEQVFQVRLNNDIIKIKNNEMDETNSVYETQCVALKRRKLPRYFQINNKTIIGCRRIREIIKTWVCRYLAKTCGFGR